MKQGQELNFIVLLEDKVDPGDSRRAQYRQLKHMLLKLNLMQGKVTEFFERIHSLDRHQFLQGVYITWVSKALVKTLILKS
jgi:hypothetical protein